MTSESYKTPRESEPRWQRQWDEKAIFASRERRPRGRKITCLRGMFPYPVGAHHIGHVRNLYVWVDVVGGALMAGAKGFQREQPHGGTAFGLPAENCPIRAQGSAPKGGWVGGGA